MYLKPLGYREGRPLSGVMTLQNFIDGGYDVVDAKILVVVKSIGVKKKGNIVALAAYLDTDMHDSHAEGRKHDRECELASTR